jgi:DegV family protein with EDD domain
VEFRRQGDFVIRIVTDSSCDLPEALIERHAISVVPLTIRFGSEEFVDRDELTVTDFWDRLTAGDVVPETAAPSVGRFRSTFERLAAEGADGIVTICISSEISATHQSAVLAAAEFDDVPVRVVDSRLVSAALGLVLIEAAGHGGGAGVDEIAGAAEIASQSTHLLATLDTLEYLRRGGRIGAAAAFFGSLLDVKPLISFTDGAVAAAGRVRTRSKAVDAVIEHLAERADQVSSVGIIHSDPSDLDEVVARVAATVQSEPLIARIGPVVGTHVGPGTAGVVYRLR